MSRGSSLGHSERHTPFNFRSSRSNAKKNLWNRIADFFSNFPIPQTEDILLEAVQECAEWKRYVEQHDEVEVLYERDHNVETVQEEIDSGKVENARASVDKKNQNDKRRNGSHEKQEENDLKNRDSTLTKKIQEEIRQRTKLFKGRKMWVLLGLEQKPTQSLKKRPFEFPLPQGDGLRHISRVTSFKLPYGIYCPTVGKERTLVPWNHVLKRNHWLVENKFEEAKIEYHLCHCSNDYCGEDCINRSLQNECTVYNCIFGGKDCGNKQFTNLYRDLTENKLYATGYEVIDTPNKGAGLLAIRSYNKGSLIVEYTGEVINLDEVEYRLDTVYKETSNYYFLGLDNDMIIDAGQRGSPARFANHSCDPNCEIQKWYVKEEPMIGLFAKKHIFAGDEITYDYNFEWFENAEPQKCCCGSANCRGIIGKKVTTQSMEEEGGIDAYNSDSAVDEDEPLPNDGENFSYNRLDSNAQPVEEKIRPNRRNQVNGRKRIGASTKKVKPVIVSFDEEDDEPVKASKRKNIVTSDDESDVQPLNKTKKKRKIIVTSDDENDAEYIFDDEPDPETEDEPELESSLEVEEEEDSVGVIKPMRNDKRFGSSNSITSPQLKWKKRVSTTPSGSDSRSKTLGIGRRTRMANSIPNKSSNMKSTSPQRVPNFSTLKKSKRSTSPLTPLESQTVSSANTELVSNGSDGAAIRDEYDKELQGTSDELVYVPETDNVESLEFQQGQQDQHRSQYEGQYPGYYDDAGNYHYGQPSVYEVYTDAQGYQNRTIYDDAAAAYYNFQDRENHYTQHRYSRQRYSRLYAPQYRSYPQSYRQILPQSRGSHANPPLPPPPHPSGQQHYAMGSYLQQQQRQQQQQEY